MKIVEANLPNFIFELQILSSDFLFQSCQLLNNSLSCLTIVQLTSVLYYTTGSLPLVIVPCPSVQHILYLDHCKASLASIWKQDFKLNFISILKHLHCGVTIPFAGNL